MVSDDGVDSGFNHCNVWVVEGGFRDARALVLAGEAGVARIRLVAGRCGVPGPARLADMMSSTRERELALVRFIICFCTYDARGLGFEKAEYWIPLDALES